MKFFISIVLLIFLDITLFGQAKVDTNSIYVLALSDFASFLDSAYNYSGKEIIFDNLPGVTEELPTEFKSHHLKFLTQKEKTASVLFDNVIPMFQIFPLKNHDREFSISFMSYSYSKSGASIAAIWRFDYLFDCTSSKFIFLRIKGGGI